MKWFVDGSGNPLDAAYDGLARDIDNLLPNSHTLLTRQEVNGSLSADNTISGNSGYGTRLYSVGRGGKIDEVEIAGDASDSQPLQTELSYLVQKARSYQIDQPDASTQLVVSSTDSNDTSVDVTLENEDGSTSETITLDGTNLVSTTASFGDIDAFELSAETQGNVKLSINDGDETSPTEGDQLAEIQGASTYDGVEGDLGVPAIDSGSRETSFSASYQKFIGDRILAGTDPYPHEIPSATLNVSNNIEETERASGYGMGLHEGNREISLEATMYGETLTHNMLERHLQNVKEKQVWEMTGGDVELLDAVLDEPGSREAEEGQAVMTTDNTFVASGINIV